MTHLASQEKVADPQKNVNTRPPLTPLLFDILLRLRTYPIVLIAVMKKAFLQIEVDERDRDCLRSLWAKSPVTEDTKVEEFRFTRVIFGVGPSLFLLNGTVRHHLMQYNVQDPEFVKRVIDSLYVDDFARSGQKADEVYDLYKKIREKNGRGRIYYAQMEDKQSRTQEKGRRNHYTFERQNNLCTTIFWNNQRCQNFGTEMRSR